MKHLLTILSGLLVALLFARCADDDNLSGGIDGLPERGIVIRLSTGELDTRTQLTSTGDYHHVEEVWAVLYKLKDRADAETATDADFEYKTHEKLEWNPMTEDEYGEGNPQGKEFLLHTDGTVLTNGTYRVLCIGLDDRSGAVYSLTNGNSSSSSLQGFSGKTLAEALAVIRGNKDCTELKPVGSQTSSLLNDPDNPDNTEDDQPEDLTSGSTISMNGDPATAELFAGWEEFVFEEDNINIVEVVLKRRVAGILCYLTDVPLKVNYDGKEQYVTGIRLCLASPAATSISLCRKEGNPTEIEDFGTLDENGGTIPFETLEGNKVTTLAYYQLPYEEQNYDITNTKETFQEGGETANYLMGVYMLPVKCTVKEILFVQLMVQEDKPTSQNQGYETGLYLPDGRYSLSMGQPGPKFIVKESNSGKKNFDIRPNYIYHIGNKDDDTDEPVSLLGQELLVEAKEWTGETIPVEFPSVPIFCTMELWGNDGIYTTQRYIFDCIGIDDVTPVGIFTGDYSIHEELRAPRLWLRINPSVLKSKWKLTIYDLDNPSENSMLYLNLGGGIYDNSYEVSDDDKNEMKQFPVVMTDNLTGNFRTAVVQLDTYDANGTNPIRSDTIHVHQYEAILNGNLGFSRFDLGTERDYRTGKVTKEYQYTWGYQDSYGIRTFFPYTSGLTNYKRAKRDADNYPNLYERAFYGGAAFYYSAVQRFTINNGKKEYNVEDDIYDVWFLPAYDEMESFMKLASSEDGNYGIKTGKAYWTGSAGDGVTSWDIFLNGTFTGGGYYGAQRTVPKYIRRACQIKTD